MVMPGKDTRTVICPKQTLTADRKHVDFLMTNMFIPTSSSNEMSVERVHEDHFGNFAQKHVFDHTNSIRSIFLSMSP